MIGTDPGIDSNANMDAMAIIAYKKKEGET
jgi:hypothetical protein